MATEIDTLKHAAIVYRQFVGKKVQLELGRKNNLEEIVINFESKDFHHLIGLHKLVDIQSVAKQTAEKVFSDILAGNITHADIQKSEYYNQIVDRLTIIDSLNVVFDNKNIVFKKNTNTNSLKINTRIRWNYLIEFSFESMQGYLFLSEQRRTPGNYFCISDFRKTQDYGRGHTRMTLLKTVLISNHNETILYKSPAYTETID